jgi:hypothetical protein
MELVRGGAPAQKGREEGGFGAVEDGGGKWHTIEAAVTRVEGAVLLS